MKNHTKTIAALAQPQREMIEQGMNVVVGLDLGDQLLPRLSVHSRRQESSSVTASAAPSSPWRNASASGRRYEGCSKPVPTRYEVTSG